MIFIIIQSWEQTQCNTFICVPVKTVSKYLSTFNDVKLTINRVLEIIIEIIKKNLTKHPKDSLKPKKKMYSLDSPIHFTFSHRVTTQFTLWCPLSWKRRRRGSISAFISAPAPLRHHEVLNKNGWQSTKMGIIRTGCWYRRRHERDGNDKRGAERGRENYWTSLSMRADGICRYVILSRCCR